MIIKTLSKKDVVLIKRSLRYISKHEALLEEHQNRINFLLSDLEKDEMPALYANVFTSLLEYDFYDDVERLKEKLVEKA